METFLINHSFIHKKMLRSLRPIFLCGRDLPFVKQVNHLGNIITDQGHMEQDAATKRASFIKSSFQKGTV